MGLTDEEVSIAAVDWGFEEPQAYFLDRDTPWAYFAGAWHAGPPTPQDIARLDDDGCPPPVE